MTEKKTEPMTVLKQLNVLYVEDDPETRQELAIYLKRRVGRLRLASNGTEALRFLGERPPHLIITDLKMPEMDGLTMIKRLREKGWEMPVIVTSALSDSETIIEAVGVGIVRYVVKPIELEELLEQMNQVAQEIIKKEKCLVVLGEQCLETADELAEMEIKIKKEVTHFMKTTTGKGPRDLHVSLTAGRIEIRARGCLTRLEEGILVNRRHYSLVDYHRRLFYTENQQTLTTCLSQVTGCPVKLREVVCDSRKDQEKLVLEIP
ncbi:Na-translocating system protein MpsC family protein [Tindallia californiensis]|uniref:Stage 0 sporulation protein A homolog n=1 Tax=Tindallia californiensis TaxID=159292 RepID=A0A1H3P715_9FIRM|nr:Na-translocating system protein MpsC family protein [Tindallia californiensis]SDY96861.1 Uncharacterized conserved protein [Tindallia californiensis]